MKNKLSLYTRLIGVLLLAVGCAQVPKKGGFDQVQQVVNERINVRPNWNQGAAEDPQVKEAVDRLLENELNAEGAIQIALLNNARLQARYEELGISQAELVQAGLLQNPTVFGFARFPTSSPSATNFEFGILQNFLNILMLPARQKIAAAQFEQVKAEVAHDVLQVTAEAERAYYEALGAANIKHLRSRVVAAAQASYEFALRLHGAGNISDLSLSVEQGQFEESRISLVESENQLRAAREKLTKLMGLWGGRTKWRAPDQLPDIPPKEGALEQVETLAIMNRLDLEAARKKIDTFAQTLGTTIAWRWLGDAEIGVNAERDTDRQWVVGPEISIELPIFDQRQAKISQGEALLRREISELTALAVDIRSEARWLRDKLIMQRYLIDHYKRVILPLRQRIVALTLEKYNYMLVGVFDLLAAKQQEFNAYTKYLEVVRDYWIIRADLGRAVGGRLPAVSPSADKPSALSRTPEGFESPADGQEHKH
jgi:cobalt-zinc-cadmium efflux system outer membrane protein